MSNDDDSLERVERTMALIRRAIDDYDLHSREYTRTVARLKGAIYALEGLVSQDWFDKARTEWGRLELVNADLLFDHRSVMTEEEESVVSASLRAIRELTATAA